jgi:cobalt/nickel transport system permease protein
MRLDPISVQEAGPLQRLDPRVKLLTTLVYVILVVATPLDHPRWLAFEGLLLAFVVGLAGLPPRVLFRRWLAFAVLVGFLAVLVAQTHPLRPMLGFGGVAAGILAQNGLAFGAMLVLAGVTPFPQLLNALTRLRTPPVLVATLHFMYRYLHVLGAELERMIQARQARSFRRSGRLDWTRLGGLIGMLFLRSMERGERVHAAMLARGWDGTLRTLDGNDA